MSASVEIETNAIPHALSIPIQAVTNYIDSAKINAKKDKKEEVKDQEEATPIDDSVLEKSGGEEVVFVYKPKEKTVKRVKVKTGIQDNTYIQILSGLKKDDQVVVSPFSAISRKLKDGTAVEVVAKDKVFE
jgi:HlyD family secretion protein